MSKTAEAQHRAWIHGLYEISKAINATLDLDRTLGVIARETQQVVAYDTQIVALLADDEAHLNTYTFQTAEEPDLRPEKATIEAQDHPFGHVVETREPLFLDDLGSEHGIPGTRALADQGLASAILLPLVSGDRVLGVLGLFRARREPFEREALEILLEVAEQTAIGVDHAHLYGVEKKRAHQLAIINEVARHALGTFDLDVLLEQTASLIQEHFAYYDVSIFTVDEEAGQVVLRAQSGSYEAESAIGYRQGLGVGMVGWTARTGETRVASNVSKDAQYVVAFEGERASRSELCVPIRIGGRTMGVINVECTELGAFDATDIAAMQTLADQIAQAVESARIYDEMLYLKELDESILASIPSALLVLDRDLTVLAVNDACCRILDRPEEQLLSAPFEELFHFELLDSALIRRTVARVVDRGELAAFPTVQVELPNGRQRTVDLHFRAIARQDERRALAFLNDITDRRQAEEEVIRERQKLNDVVSAMGAGLALIDSDGTVSWSNSTLEAWFNDGESLIGHDCHDFCHTCSEGEKPRSDCAISIAFEDATIARSTQSIHTDHQTRHYENVFAPIREESGNVIQVIRLTFDVTEHVHKVDQLTLLQKLSQTMGGALDLDRLLHLVLTCVTAGPGLGFNRAILLLEDDQHTRLEGRLGVGPASGEEASRIWRELASQPLTLADHILHLFEQEVERTESPMQYVAQQIRVPLTEKDHVLVRTFHEKQPHVVHDAKAEESVPDELPALLGANEFVCVPLVAHGTPLGAIIADKVFTAEAITDDEVEMLKTFASHAGAAIQAAASYRRLEEQLRELQDTQDRMVRAERLATVGRLAAHVAHEIRNPLVTIGGFARSILRKPDQLQRVERNAQIILDEVERLEQILANVMNFTKPGNPVFQDRNVNEIAEAVCAFHENVFADNDIELEKDLDADCPTLRIDPGQIRQVLINIVQNGVDSMPEGGKLTVRTRADQDQVRIAIADNGEGMSQEVLDNLFQPFYTTKVGGTGLGLAASQKIVQEHGGDITVESKPGQGSTFTISLPIPEQSDAKQDGETVQ